MTLNNYFPNSLRIISVTKSSSFSVLKICKENRMPLNHCLWVGRMLILCLSNSICINEVLFLRWVSLCGYPAGGGTSCVLVDPIAIGSSFEMHIISVVRRPDSPELAEGSGPAARFIFFIKSAGRDVACEGSGTPGEKTKQRILEFFEFSVIPIPKICNAVTL